MTTDPETAIPNEAQANWLRLAPSPRPRMAGVKWDVFVSYRSINRTWALALYDALREAGFTVFLDQFVLPAGIEIEGFLRDNLKASASGVVIWSGDASTSRFVAGELGVMRKLSSTRPDFRYVLATLDSTALPFLEQSDLYVDFASYPDGPRGGELLKLMFGLTGQPLSEAAAREINEVDQETSTLVRKIKAARSNGLTSALSAIAARPSAALLTTSLPYSVLVESLIELGENELALEVVGTARRTFSQAIRLQQLEALALRRLKRIEDAQLILADLYEQGHRDPETLGILGATWALRYKTDKRRAHLERSQSYYAEAFRLAPDSYYNGINAASKAALLGHLDESLDIAGRVLPLVEQFNDGQDYWGTSTHAEVRLLRREYDEAALLYRAAVVRHSQELGNIDTTRLQAGDLLDALGADQATKGKVLPAFV